MKTFKLLNLLLLALVLATTLYSCGKDGDEDDSNLTSTAYVKETGGNNYFTEGMNFSSSAADEQKLNFRTNADWTISGANAWCTLSSEGGKKGAHSVMIAVAENTGHDDRNVTLTFRAGTATETIVVTQKQKDAIILSQSNYTVAAEGETIEVKLNANVDFEVKMPAVDWISKVPETRGLTESKLSFIISENKERDNRSAEIVFVNKDKNVRDVVTVVQEESTGIKTVTVESAGTLSNYVTTKETDLKINGPLNGNDIKHLRSMSGTLVYLDLAEASIVTGGDYYYSLGTACYYSYNNTIGGNMFYKMRMLGAIVLPNSVTSIESDAFAYCRALASVVIPNSVTSIGHAAFLDCAALTNIVIPNSVTSIGTAAFLDCVALTNIVIPNSVTSIESTAFEGCGSLTNITMSNYVTTIGYAAFRNCLALTSVIIPNSVTSLGSLVFYKCRSLASVTINCAGKIRDKSFYDCANLVRITIGENVTEIETSSFAKCDAIEEIHMKCSSPPKFVYEDSFTQTCYNSCTLYVPKGSKEKYSASNWSRFKNIVEE